MPPIRWILVAEQSMAKIFESPVQTDKLKPVKSFIHPAGSWQEKDYYADKPGRSFDSVGAGRHAMGHEVSATEHESQTFIKEVCQFLENQFNQQAYELLVVLAAPRTLGLVRNNLADKIKKILFWKFQKSTQIGLQIIN